MTRQSRAGRLGVTLRTHWSLLTVQLFLFVPAFVLLALYGARGAFAYLSGDSLYYLVVGRNMAELGLVSFDQTRPTNGFHPLWQGMVAVAYGVASVAGMSREGILILVFLLSLLLVAAALFVIYRVMDREYHGAGLLFLMFPAGVFGCFAFVFVPVTGAMFHFANGMESGILLLAYAGFVNSMTTCLRAPSCGAAMMTGLALAAVALARLDHALLAAAAIPWMMVGTGTWRGVRDRAKHALLAFAIVSVALGAYMLWSRLYVGTWFPVSGAVKSSFPNSLLQPHAAAIRQAIHALFVNTGYPHRDPFVWRGLQLILPLGMAVLYIVVTAVHALAARKTLPPMTQVLVITGITTIGLSLYNLLFVQLYDQGEWYVPVGILFMTLAVYDLLRRFTPGYLRARRSLRAVAVVVLLGFNAAMASTLTEVRNTYIYWNIFVDASELNEHYAGRDVRLLTFEDAVFAFATPFPTMNGLMFTTDPEAVHLIREEGVPLLEIAYRRGYRHIATLVYTQGAFSVDMDSEETRHALRHHSRAFLYSYQAITGPLPFDFRVDFVSGSGRAAVIEMVPKAPGAS